jgi:hypothetical protein
MVIRIRPILSGRRGLRVPLEGAAIGRGPRDRVSVRLAGEGRSGHNRLSHRKSGKWRRRADSSPVAKGRRVKHHGVRNPRKRKHLGGKGL